MCQTVREIQESVTTNAEEDSGGMGLLQTDSADRRCEGSAQFSVVRRVLLER